MSITSEETSPLRVGLLGASRIALEAVISPAHDAGARLVAVAARDPERAKEFASEHGVEQVATTYEDLINNPEIDVVYNALPNAMHAPWNLAAIAAGKHVLTEKPFASNAAEARQVAAVAAEAGVVVFDAFHYRYHPIFLRLLELMAGDHLGALESVHVQLLMAAPDDTDLRWSLPLAGGAMMDLGCYALHAISTMAAARGGAPTLVAAQAGERQGRPGVDEWFRAALTLPGSVPATAYCDMDNAVTDMSITVTGTAAEAKIINFVKVSSDDRLIVRTHDGVETIEHLGTRSSYHYQFDALTAAIQQGTPFPTDAADGVANLELIDACYRRAGLSPRPRLHAE